MVPDIPAAAADSAPSGRRVVVTGAGRGIGQAIVEAFVARGDRVDAVDRAFPDVRDARSVQRRLCDLSDPEALARLTEAVTAEPVDVLVNNAAVSLGGDALSTSAALWQTTLAVNLTAPYVLSQAVARAMIGFGRPGVILMTASVNSFASEKAALSYVVAKHGLVGLVRSLAVDLARHGIRVNAIAPGPIRHDHNADQFDAGPYRYAIERGVPLGRAGTAAEVAAVVVAMSDPALSYVTGSTLVVDGGYTAYLRMD